MKKVFLVSGFLLIVCSLLLLINFGAIGDLLKLEKQQVGETVFYTDSRSGYAALILLALFFVGLGAVGRWAKRPR